MATLRLQLKWRLKQVLSQSEWDALDDRLKDNLVKKAVQDKKFTRLSPDKLLAKLRAKLARADAGGANAPGGRPSPLAPLHDVMAQCHKRQRLDEHTAARSGRAAPTRSSCSSCATSWPRRATSCAAVSPTSGT